MERGKSILANMNKHILTEEKVPKISLQQALDSKLFGPVYHGTSAEARDKIAMDGFKIPIGRERSGAVANGFETSNYSGGIPAPIHMLGFGVYFTTVKNIAKQFSGGTLRGLKVYYLDAPRMETINFGSPGNMMKWWMKNGYDYKVSPLTTFGNPTSNLRIIGDERLRATINMTKELSSKLDAVWYEGKGFYKLLDGDQVCVFDTSKIYEIDMSLAKGFDVGAKVRVKHRVAHLNYRGEEYKVVEDGDTGIIVGKQDIVLQREQYPLFWAKRAVKYVLEVKFKKSGRQYVEDVDVEPLSQ